jgi:hypothetical protein
MASGSPDLDWGMTKLVQCLPDKCKSNVDCNPPICAARVARIKAQASAQPLVEMGSWEHFALASFEP